MNKLFIILLFLLPLASHSQYYDVMGWSNEGELQSGIRIQTKIPIDNTLHLQSVQIDGYDRGRAASIGLKISWTLINGEFENATASSYGGIAPMIFLLQKDGFIQIFLKTWGTNTQIHVTAFAEGSNDLAEWFHNWNIKDEAFDGENKVEAIYHNEFGGDIQANTVNASDIAASRGHIGVLSVENFDGQVSATCSSVDNGGIQLNPCEGGIEIKNPNAGWGYIDFAGKGNINANFIGRIIHTDGQGFAFYTAGAQQMTINDQGIVKIGSTTPVSSNIPYKLYVGGGIRTRKVKVDQLNWPDYVFEPSYNLRPLASLEDFIKVNKHLPDLPGADEVEKGGVDLGETQAALLKKVEELTLYVIEQGKVQKALSKKLEEQQQIIAGQQQSILHLQNHIKN